MGAKVNPNGLRFGINRQWISRWVAKDNKETAKWLVQDDQIRQLIYKKYKNALVDHVEIERSKNAISLFIFVGQPGLIVGSEGAELKKLISEINKIVKDRHVKVFVDVTYVEKPDLSARIVAREIADAIENRVAFRIAQKLAIKKVLAAGAVGVKTHVSGRLGGVEMARDEGYSEGIVTLSTLRSNIDYAIEKAHTTYGIIGVKVWINKGEIFKKDLEERRPRFDRRRRENGNGQNGRDFKPRRPQQQRDGQPRDGQQRDGQRRDNRDFKGQRPQRPNNGQSYGPRQPRSNNGQNRPQNPQSVKKEFKKEA